MMRTGITMADIADALRVLSTIDRTVTPPTSEQWAALRNETWMVADRIRSALHSMDVSITTEVQP